MKNKRRFLTLIIIGIIGGAVAGRIAEPSWDVALVLCIGFLMGYVSAITY